MLMVRRIAFIVCFSVVSAAFASAKGKNVILMIPDGTSTSVLSLARWYQFYGDSTVTQLALDPYLCGLLRTHSSNAPIGDSAPTTSCYMTGQLTQSGFVSMYPLKTDNDLVPIDAKRAYQPMTTLLEAAKSVGKGTGLVCTCEFPHATPADCASHYYDRANYYVLGKQMVYNHIDVVIAGGANLLRRLQLDDDVQHLGYALYADDKVGLLSTKAERYWGVFGDHCLPYELDRDTTRYPSLAQMTRKALQTLAKHKNGFFLMVEGSKVDWAAHANDAKTLITEFLAFDKAVSVALDFARRDGNTVVVVLPDHGNSAISMGSRNTYPGYDRMALTDFFDFMCDYRLSADSLTHLIRTKEDIRPVLQNCCKRTPTDEEVDELWLYKYGNHRKISFERALTNYLYGKSPIGFTSYGHTGEDVFLAVYHPQNQLPHGLQTNRTIYAYMLDQLGLTKRYIDRMTADNFVSHRQLFATAATQIDSTDRNNITLIVHQDNHILKVESYTDRVSIDGRCVPLGSVVVYVDKNKTFYLPRRVAYLLKQSKK